ncbi:protein kinase 1 [Hemileuca sp. nucleopolyhedrovirus]|uniref:Protein kinase 1 n=1 Tax=Hemileuca sp. nucleopolyhedrovirus TaxID=1367203 RepID=S5N335_9ABAC|nr:protein kinase 1 [Hemileuca sp. nucleopolyhedrovirus]AGR56755.1 protein kinase 1 [Hemileuca sp. nucleopolyhedrovirus]
MDMFTSEFNDFIQNCTVQKQYNLVNGKFGKISVYKHEPTQKELFFKYIKTKHFNPIESYVHYLMKDNKFFIKLFYSFNCLRGHLLIMDFIKDGDLFDRLKNDRRRFSENEVKLIVSQLCDALSALHSHRIIHNDIKLENILCTNKLRIYLCDYGLCKHIGSETIYDGTVDYFSPEKIDKRPCDVYFDWWAIGVLTYELITGKHPYTFYENEDLTLEKLQARQQAKIEFPDSKCSTRLQNFINNMLKYNINYRLTTYKQIKQHVFFNI